MSGCALALARWSVALNGVPAVAIGKRVGSLRGRPQRPVRMFSTGRRCAMVRQRQRPTPRVWMMRVDPHASACFAHRLYRGRARWWRSSTSSPWPSTWRSQRLQARLLSRQLAALSPVLCGGELRNVVCSDNPCMASVLSRCRLMSCTASSALPSVLVSCTVFEARLSP